MERKKITIPKLLKMKRQGDKITMRTAYDCPTARLLDEAGVETILTGDSLGNVVLGYADTLPVTMDDMIRHTAAAARGIEYAFLIGDMPFMSYQASVPQAVENAGRFIKEGRAEAVKLEGGARVVDRVKSIVSAGIPVCGHLGLTPQSATMLGGYKAQGTTAEGAQILIDDALRLEDAGVFMIIIECVPSPVGEKMSRAVKVPVVGIGAGLDCDGQVLVLHDMLGIEAGFTPKFVKKYAAVGDAVKTAARKYMDEVKKKVFPDAEHSFEMEESELEKLK